MCAKEAVLGSWTWWHPWLCTCTCVGLCQWEREIERETTFMYRRLWFFLSTFSISFNRNVYLWTHNRIWPSVPLIMFFHMSTCLLAEFVSAYQMCLRHLKWGYSISQESRFINIQLGTISWSCFWLQLSSWREPICWKCSARQSVPL